MHSIRLRGPWRFEILPFQDFDGKQGELRLPCDWSEVIPSDWPHSNLRVRFCRSFNRPTGITPSDRIDVVISNLPQWESLDPSVSINGQAINGEPHPAGDAWRYEIAERLDAHNELVIQLQLESSGKHPGQVALQSTSV